MKKIVISIFVILIAVGIAFMVYSKIVPDPVTPDPNDPVVDDEKNRYLTIVNDTGEIINEVHVSVGEGTELEHAYRENPDKTSFSIEILESYDDYKKFTVTLIDRYGLKYQKEMIDVKEKGRTEVKITTDDYVKQDGDWKKKWDRFFNKD